MGRKQTEETKAKLRAIKRKPMSEATKAKIRKTREGKKLSTTTKAKISAALRGHHHHHKGHSGHKGTHHRRRSHYI